ncbi:MAG: hypothetical protein PHQ40_04370 [Anaerolineaceae bacterium]|nr:hypothetical protein [Anaerolineaceae bacterium]
MSRAQKGTLWVIVIICLTYFILFAIPNATGAQTEQMLKRNSQDEPFTYSFVVEMLTWRGNLKATLWRFFHYADYHYGFPFYGLSALAILPVRLAYGDLYTDHVQLNLWILRQFISVLPMILAVGLLVYLQTRFRSLWKSVGLLLLLLLMRAVVRNNLHWWHPDALSMLTVVLTIFFLDRDRLRFRRNFYLAAITCGLAIGIKLVGFFFVFTLAGYLAIGLFRRILRWPNAVIAGFVFLAVMGASLFLSNIFLLNPGPRQRMIEIQQYKSSELSQGYSHDDPLGYQKGPQFWEWTVRTWFEYPAFILFLVISLVIGCCFGPNRFTNRLILAWVAPYSLYLLFFVAVKPDHYFVPAMLPLFSAALALPEALPDFFRRYPAVFAQRQKVVSQVALALVIVILASHVIHNFVSPYSGIVVQYANALFQE